jgi:hypothetical protein
MEFPWGFLWILFLAIHRYWQKLCQFHRRFGARSQMSFNSMIWPPHCRRVSTAAPLCDEQGCFKTRSGVVALKQALGAGSEAAYS